jgi:hypothetical protein
MLSSGLFTGVCNLSTNVSAHCLLFHLHRRVGMLHTHSSMKMEQTECSEMLVFKLEMLVNNPEECIQHSEHSKSLKSRVKILAIFLFVL